MKSLDPVRISPKAVYIDLVVYLDKKSCYYHVVSFNAEENS